MLELAFYHAECYGPHIIPFYYLVIASCRIG